MDCSTPGFADNHQYIELAQNHVYQVSDAIQPSHPLAPLNSPSLQSFSASGPFPMSQLVKSMVRWSKYFSFSISPSNDYSGLISFSIDWFALLAVQGTLHSHLQYHSLVQSICPLVLCFLYGSTLTSIHVYWKNCIFDSLGLCQISNLSAFLYAV